MHTNEINQEQMTFHLYNYIYKREKKGKKDILREKRGLPLFSDGKFQYLCGPFQKSQKMGQLTCE